jgi:Tol biopolymer transport system component
VPTGLTFSGGDGVGDTSMTFTGSIADINNALEGLVFTPDNGFSGTATLTITTNDQGNTGSGGALQDVDTVDITVGSATNTAPTLVNNAGLTAAEGSTTVITNTQLGYTDAQQPASSIVYTVTTSPANGQLELTTNPDVAITSFTQAQIDAGEVVYVHDGSETAADSFGFTVDDGQGNYASGPSVVGIGTLTNVTNGISNARAPDYSPDGSKVVFSRNNDIYIMNADGSNQTPLVTAAGGDFQAVWSPDGSKIAFTSNRDGNDEIYVIDVDGTNETRITSHVAKDSAPAWSPDSSKIAFTSDRDGDKEIWVMDADGSNLVQLTDNTAITDGGASWSPDGSKIVFQSTRDGGDYEIYVMNADGSGQTRLTSEAGIDALGDWSPDGSKLLFYSERDGNREIYVMDADGSNQVRLTNDAGEDIEAEWSPDGTSILFVSDRDGDYDIYSASVIYENTFAITVTPVNDAPTFIEGAFGNWSFDEGSGDSVGESAIGISGGTLGSTAGADANDPTWTTGVFGQALHFDGVDDYVEIADAPGIDISGPEFSASLWMNPDSGPNTEDMLFMKGDRTGDVNYYLSWKDTNVFTWAFRESGVWHYQDMPVTTMPTTGEWNHIGITFDRPTVTLYVNGDKYVFDNVATGGSMDNDLTANDDVLWIGAGRSGGSLVGVNQFSGPFAGSIDELALFDRALTDADMEVIRASAPPVVTASAFSLDENSANNTVVGTVAAYDPDVGDTLSYAITAGNTGGAFAIDANGQITVANSAALDFETNPVFTLTVEATDDGSPNLSDSTTVTITLNNVNDAPVATDDSATTDENTPVAIDLLANDSDAETDPLTATIVSGPANGTLVFTPTDVVNETNLTNGSWNDRQAAWSPDGSQILFRSDRDGNHEIYVMDADGSNLIRLTNDAGTDGTPAWSPDGTQILFGSNRDGDYEIYVMDADGSNVVQLTNNAAADVGAQWSPDGTQIVFVSNRDGNNEIYVMNADGSGQTRLTTAAGRADASHHRGWQRRGPGVVTGRHADRVQVRARR